MRYIFIFIFVIVLEGCGGGDEESFIDSGTTQTKPSTETSTENSLAIVPTVETSPTANSSAKTATIWVHPTDSAQSAVIGADQVNGLEVYDLQGNLLQNEPAGEINAVDLRYNFPLNNQSVTILAASNRSENSLDLYSIDPDTLQVTNVAARSIKPSIQVESLCMYHSLNTDKYYVMVMNDNGNVQQWELIPRSNGTVNAQKIRNFNVRSEIHACVADDQYAHLYIAKADNDIFKYGAEPQDGTGRNQIKTSSPVTSLTLYYATGQTGYLLASTSSENNDFLVYQRGNDNPFLDQFTIVEGNEIDEVKQSDGMSVTNVALGQDFPQGLLIVQDTNNTEPTDNTNYKLVPWQNIANSLGLKIDTSFNPRQPEPENQTDIIRQVQATVETEPVSVEGDAADDIAIWIHPRNTALSTIIGTQKQGSLLVYDLTGKQIQELPDGKMNNVDLRYHYPLGLETITLVAASNRTNNSIAFYKINSKSRKLENVAARTITVGLKKEIYGLCMYHKPLTEQYYVFVNDKNGMVEQWEMFNTGKGQVDANLVRSFNVGSQTEGCVADDELAFFYIGEENVGIWKYSADLDGGETRIQVDTTGPNGHLTSAVEGLTIYNGGRWNGYLIASSQGSNTFTIYQRSNNNDYIGTFQIVTNNSRGIDNVSNTDGIDVSNVPLNNTFPFGVLVVQDGWNSNPVENQNFKLVPWEQIADAFGLTKNVNDNPWE